MSGLLGIGGPEPAADRIKSFVLGAREPGHQGEYRVGLDDEGVGIHRLGEPTRHVVAIELDERMAERVVAVQTVGQSVDSASEDV